MGMQAHGQCLLFDWDTVTGGSSIFPYTESGECGYEIDTEGGAQPAFLQADVPTEFEDSADHQIRFRFKGTQLDENDAGDFRIMALFAGNVNDPFVALDVSWARGAFGRNKIMKMTATIKPELMDPAGMPIQNQNIPDPVEIENPFEGWIPVAVLFTQSSGPGIGDGVIELWVDGALTSVWSGLYLDWPHSNPPTAVSYGVVDVFDPRTSGILNIIPDQPSPHDIEF